MKRQRKPYVTTKKGRLYYRLTWMQGGKRRERFLPLPGQEDSAEFDRAYWAIRSGTAPELKVKSDKSVEALVQSYRASSSYKNLAAGTKRKYDAVIERLREKNGDIDVRKITRQQVRAIHEKYADKPRKADHYLQVLRILLKYAKDELDWIETNPATGIKVFGTQKSHKKWTETAQMAYVSAARALGDEVAETFFMLGTHTGQRPGDCCAMEWGHYNGTEILVTQDKQREDQEAETMWVYCPPDLRAYLDALPKRGRFFMPKNLTEPLGYDAVYRRFKAVREKAGNACAGLVPHGWRHTAGVALAEAGCSDAEIMAVLGHKTAVMAALYRRQAQQRKLARQAQERRK